MRTLAILFAQINDSGLSTHFFMVSIIVVIFLSVLICALLGLISGRLFKLRHISYKKSLLANFCNVIITLVLHLLYLLFPMNIQLSSELAIFNLFLGFFVMSYLYASFFTIPYKQGMLVTLISATLGIIIFLIVTFVLSFFM